MVAIKRLEQEHFVARIEQGHRRGVKSPGSSAGHQDFCLRVVSQAVILLLFLGDRVAQAGDAVKPRIDVVTCVDGGMGFCLDGRGNGGVADSLGKVDAADTVALRGHCANFRLHDAGGKLAQSEAGRGVRVVR